MNGILVVNKAAGYTSFDCVAVVRRASGERKLGHTGTLDPMATGVLPIALGRATRLIEYMTNAGKSYRCTCKLGIETDTQDLTGKIIGGAVFSGCADFECPNKVQIEEALSSFKGEISQLPPMYSAVRINGKKLYEYARKGQDVDVKPRKVIIKDIKLISYDTLNAEFCFEISCSKGTYVRTICNDIGRMLGCGAAMSSLERTAAAGFTLADAVGIEDVKSMSAADIESRLLPFDAAVRFLPRAELTDSQKKKFFEGKPEFSESIDISGLSVATGEPVALFESGIFCGIANVIEKDGKKILKAHKVFN